MKLSEVKIFFVDETKADKKGKELTLDDKKNWYWGIVALWQRKEKQEDPESDAQKMYKNILIF